MIDLVYLAHNRLEFTKASLEALRINTNWDLVGHLFLYDDDSTDGARECLAQFEHDSHIKTEIVKCFGRFGHPVTVMRDYLQNFRYHTIFGKIDSDTMVPAGWLEQCLDVMNRNPDLDLLGIEAFNPIEPNVVERGYTDARFIGGIGLMRQSAFDLTLPETNGRYFGFTEWQEWNPQVKKGWLNPSLPVFLLDRMPHNPWRQLSEQYIENGWQRRWPPYNPASREMWSWWMVEV